MNSWSPEEDAILLKNAGKIHLKEIISRGLLPKRTVLAASMRLKKIGVKTGMKNTLHSTDLEFFKIPNLLNSYWAGFLMADGSLIKNKGKTNSYRLTLSISVKDRDHLVKYQQALKHTGEIKHKMQTFGIESSSSFGKQFEFCYLDVCQAGRFLPDLAQFGIIQNKTKRIVPPALTDDLLKLAYMKGYIDGDGCITVFEADGFKRCAMGITSSCKVILDWFRELNELYFPIQYFNREHSNVTKNASESWQYNVTGYRALRIAEFLSRLPTPGLERKWAKPELHQLIAESKAKHPDWWSVRLPIENRLDALLVENSQLSSQIFAPPL